MHEFHNFVILCKAHHAFTAICWACRQSAWHGYTNGYNTACMHFSLGIPEQTESRWWFSYAKFNSELLYLFLPKCLQSWNPSDSYCNVNSYIVIFVLKILYTGSPYEHVLIAYSGLWAICSLLLANKGPQSLLFWAPSLPAAIHYWASLEACRSAENHTTCSTLSCLHISLLLLLKLPGTKASSISPQRATTPIQFEEGLCHDLSN